MDIREAAKFGFAEYLVSDRSVNDDERHLLSMYEKLDIDYRRLSFQFPNGYIASVIRTPGSYGSDRGLWEVAVIYEGRVVYDTPVTNDVLGNLDIQEVRKILEEIYNLPIRTINE